MPGRSRLHVDRGAPLSADARDTHCPKCGRSKAACECRPASRAAQPSGARPPADGIARVARSTKGRKGKGVTLVTGLRLPPDQLEALCKQLKQRFGAGGAVKDGTIELQGDHRDEVLAELQARGHAAKLAGG